MHYLLSIEQGRLDQLPGGLIGRAFFRAYLNSIGLEGSFAAEICAAVDMATTLRQVPTAECDSLLTQYGQRLMQLSPWFATGLLLCIYFIFIISGLRWREHSQSPQRSTAVPVISAPSDLNSSATRVADKTAAVNKLPLRKQMGSAALRNPSELSTFTLSIRVRQDAWMSIIADGRRVLTETLVAPTETLVEAHRQIWIRAGNIGAVDFSFNGAGLPAQGAYDEARTLTFNANGLQTQLDSGTPANTPLSIAVGQSRR